MTARERTIAYAIEQALSTHGVSQNDQNELRNGLRLPVHIDGMEASVTLGVNRSTTIWSMGTGDLAMPPSARALVPRHSDRAKPTGGDQHSNGITETDGDGGKDCGS